MNKIYRLVWSRARGAFVVVSELARRRTAAVRRKGLQAFCLPGIALLGMASESGAYTLPPPGACTNGAVVAVGRLVTGPTADAPEDGSGLLSTVAGCEATGNGQTAVTVFGAYSSATGQGGTALGYNAGASKWALANGLETRATGIGSTALGFGSNATGLNSLAIGGAGGNGTTALSVAASTTASGDGAIAIGANATRGAQATAADSIALGAQATASNAGAMALGRGATAGQAGAVALGDASTTAVAVATTSVTIAGATYTFAGTAPASTVSIGGGGSERTLTNLAAGRLSSTSTDAVNGSQLNATNLAVTAADAATDALGAGTAAALGGGAGYDPATGTLSPPSYSLDGGTVTADNVGDALTNLDGRTTSNTTAITNLGDQINSGTIGLVQQDATTRDITVAAATDGTRVDFTGTAGARTLAGVAIGTVAVGSTEAINGSQLYAGNSSIATIFGGGAAVNADGTLAAPSYQIGSTTYNNVGDALGGVNTVLNDISTGGGIQYFRANSTLADATASGTDAVAIGPLATASATNATALGNGATAGQAGAVALGSGSVTAAAVGTSGATIAGTAYTFAGATPASTVSIGAAGNERTLTNLAAGRLSTTSTDAVNGSQLNATNLAVTAADAATDALGAGTAAALGGGAGYDPATGTLSSPSYSLDGGTVTADNVGDALTNLDGRTTSNTTAITNLGDQINDGTIGLVQQDATTRDIIVAAATDGTRVDFTGTAGARTLAGVAIGAVAVGSTEAINGSQLYAGTAASLRSSVAVRRSTEMARWPRLPTRSAARPTTTSVTHWVG